MRKRIIFDRQKANLIYDLEMNKVRERHNNERMTLFDDLQRRGMRNHGFGDIQIEELVAKHIEESLEIYVNSILSTLDDSRTVSEKDENVLIQNVVNLLEARVKLESSLATERLHASGLANDKNLHDATLAGLQSRSLSTRQYLIKKIRLKTKDINDKLSKDRKSFLKKIFSTDFFKTGKDMLYKWFWRIIGLIALGFLLFWWRSCGQQEEKRNDTVRNQVSVSSRSAKQVTIKLAVSRKLGGEIVYRKIAIETIQ